MNKLNCKFMAGIFSYFLGFVLIGAPAGLAIYHYVVREGSAGQQTCNCQVEVKGEECKSRCKKK
ncbi:hypothetical protein OVS_02855 [Mycoplasma ovis str. Michigan]|uniref:Molecular chaperone DnaJ n=2 Tax=Mycoplasma ovis TaxID=171632 RepID=A0ABM5P1R1_9MOLU|nr:hypothetical protein OVS_02855 [Mycoplasma ovis str. Michigan]